MPELLIMRTVRKELFSLPFFQIYNFVELLNEVVMMKLIL